MFNKKIFSSILVSLALLFCLAGPSSASLFGPQEYECQGTLATIQGMEITVVDYQSTEAFHIVVPPEFKITPMFCPGDKVRVKMYKTNRGAWTFKSMKKL